MKDVPGWRRDKKERHFEIRRRKREGRVQEMTAKETVANLEQEKLSLFKERERKRELKLEKVNTQG